MNNKEFQEDDIIIRSRVEDMQESMQMTTDKELNEINKALAKEETRKQKKAQKKWEIENSSTYRTVKKISTYMDKYFLDGIIGFFPGVGDTITTFFSIPYFYLSIFKIKSLPLTLAITLNLLVDWMLGMIPYMIGNVADFFHRSFKKNMDLIIGFVEDDKEIIQKVNQKAAITAVLIVLVILIIYWLITAIIGIITGAIGFIGSLFG